MGNACCNSDPDRADPNKAKDHFTPMGNLNENMNDHLPPSTIAYLDNSTEAEFNLNHSSENIIRVASIDSHEYKSQYNQGHGPYK